MKSSLRSFTRFRGVLFAAGILLALAVPSLSGHAQVAVIANTSVSASEISRADLRDVFTGAASSIKGSGEVSPVLLKGSSTHEEFLDKYIGKSDAAFRAGWRSLLFSGQNTMPKTFDSDAEMVDYIAHTHGAIGYIASSSPHSGVKTLAVR